MFVVINLYIVIMGGGCLGIQLAKELIANKKNVTIIEMDEKYKYLSSNTDCLILNTIGTDISTLENSNVDTFVEATGNVDSNLLTSLIVRKLGVKTIIVTINEPQLEPVFISNNFINVIFPETLDVGHLKKLVLKLKIADLSLVFQEEAELLEPQVNNPYTIGKTVGEMNLDDGYLFAVYTNDESTLSITSSDML